MNINRFKQLLESQMGDVKPLINEQSVQDCDSPGAVSFFKKKYPEVIKMATYADDKIGSRMNKGSCAMKINGGYMISTSSSSSFVPGTDDNYLKFLAYDNGKTEIQYSNDFGIDPKPIPFPKTFEEFKKWFDSVGFMG